MAIRRKLEKIVVLTTFKYLGYVKFSIVCIVYSFSDHKTYEIFHLLFFHVGKLLEEIQTAEDKLGIEHLQSHARLAFWTEIPALFICTTDRIIAKQSRKTTGIQNVLVELHESLIFTFF